MEETKTAEENLIKNLHKMRNLAWQIGIAAEYELMRVGNLEEDKRLFVPQKERKAKRIQDGLT